MNKTQVAQLNQQRIQQVLAQRQLAQKRLLPFVQANVPRYKAGWVHKEICQKLEKFERDIVAGKSPRLMLFMPPRHGKSELASTQFPAWFLGRNPDREIIACSYSSTLAMSFSKKVREIIRSTKFTSTFPDCALAKDSQSTENWMTTQMGGYLAAGVGGGITGRGADCFIIDDPVKNREDAESATNRELVGNWYSSTARTRLEPGAGVLLILTRWHQDDLAGRLLHDMKHGGEQWEIIVYPAEAIHKEKYRNVGDPLHPDRYNADALKALRKSMTARDWGALFQQSPSTEAGSILKRQDWNRWCEDTPPDCTYLIQSLDTAYSAKEQADYSVITTWGLFKPKGRMDHHELQLEYEEGHVFTGKVAHIILLDVVRKRMSFTELKKEALRLNKHWKPDSTIIEAKASGMPLAHELRQGGVPVQTFTPGKGSDKLTRVNSISVLLENGLVWAPKHKWADDLIEECHNFPNSKYDDQVDSTTGALMRFRKGGLIPLSTDHMEEFQPRRKMSYY
jgi:predicted phage terminase large subunit-like protein